MEKQELKTITASEWMRVIIDENLKSYYLEDRKYHFSVDKRSKDFSKKIKITRRKLLLFLEIYLLKNEIPKDILDKEFILDLEN